MFTHFDAIAQAMIDELQEQEVDERERPNRETEDEDEDLKRKYPGPDFGEEGQGDYPVGVINDYIAYYCPLTLQNTSVTPIGTNRDNEETFRFNSDGAYGIHFPKKGAWVNNYFLRNYYKFFSHDLRRFIRHFMPFEIWEHKILRHFRHFNLRRNDLEQIFPFGMWGGGRSSSFINDYKLAGFSSVYFHEVGHYLIEKMSWMVADRFGLRKGYTQNKDHIAEEAFCNSIANFGLSGYLAEKVSSNTLSVHDSNLISVFNYILMRTEPAGYRDFIEINAFDIKKAKRPVGKSKQFERLWVAAIGSRLQTNLNPQMIEYVRHLIFNIMDDLWPAGLTDKLVPAGYFKTPIHLHGLVQDPEWGLLNNMILAGHQVGWFDDAGTVSKNPKRPYAHQIDELFVDIFKERGLGSGNIRKVLAQPMTTYQSPTPKIKI